MPKTIWKEKNPSFKWLKGAYDVIRLLSYLKWNQICQNDNIARRQQPYVNCYNKKYESPTSSGKEAVAQVKVFEK